MVSRYVADADTTVAKIALEYQSAVKHVVINADDTDILCILGRKQQIIGRKQQILQDHEK